jgi:hypothetical protein
MARTLNGNLTGRAARIHDELYPFAVANFNLRFQDAVDALCEIDPDEWEAWYDGRPEQTKGEMLPLMEARIAELKQKRIIAIGRRIDGLAEIRVDPSAALVEANNIRARLAEDPLTDVEAENLTARLDWLEGKMTNDDPIFYDVADARACAKQGAGL